MDIANMPLAFSRRRNSVFSDKMNHDDDDKIAAERRRVFEEQQKRDNKIQQALTDARKRMESGRGAIELMMEEDMARTQKMANLEAEVAKLQGLLTERDMAIAQLTQTVIKEREQWRNERDHLLHHTMPIAMTAVRDSAIMDITTEMASAIDETPPAMMSRKRKRGINIPTPPRSDVAAFEGDSGIGIDDYGYGSDGEDEDAPVVSSSPLLRRAKGTANLRSPVQPAAAEISVHESNRAPITNAPSPICSGQIESRPRLRRVKPIPFKRVYNLRPRKPINYKIWL